MKISPLCFNNYGYVNKNNFNKSNTVSNSISFGNNLTKDEEARIKKVFNEMNDTLDISKISAQTKTEEIPIFSSIGLTNDVVIERSIKEGCVYYCLDSYPVTALIQIKNSNVLGFAIESAGMSSSYSAPIFTTIYNTKTGEIAANGYATHDNMALLEKMWNKIKEFETKKGNIKTTTRQTADQSANYDAQKRIKELEAQNAELKNQLKTLIDLSISALEESDKRIKELEAQVARLQAQLNSQNNDVSEYQKADKTREEKILQPIRKKLEEAQEAFSKDRSEASLRNIRNSIHIDQFEYQLKGFEEGEALYHKIEEFEKEVNQLLTKIKASKRASQK